MLRRFVLPKNSWEEWMILDSVIEEVRATREAYAAQFWFDTIAT